MGIRFHCPYCQKKLNVKAFLAGKRGICPYCDSGLDIPLESEPRNGKGKLPTESVEVETVPREGETALAGPEAQGAAEAGITNSPNAEASPSESGGRPATESVRISAEATPAEASKPPSGLESNGPDAIDENPEAVWYVRPPSGGQFGPAKGDVMRKWLDEGRVSPDSLVWREGWADWQEAEPTFPSLSKRSAPPSPPTPAPTTTSGPSAGPSTSSQAVAVAKPAARMVADSGPAEPEPKPDTTATRALARRRSNLPALIAVGVLVVVSIGLLVGLIVALNTQS